LTYSPFHVIAFLLALGTLFAVVIFFSFLSRQKNIAKNLALKAEDVWPQIRDAGFDFSDLLYGIWEDFSATERGMVVRDSYDRKVATIIYHTAVLQGSIMIETADGTFEADLAPDWRERFSLRTTRDRSQSLCEFTRLVGGEYLFTANSLGALNSKPPGGLSVSPLFEYTLKGKPVGASRRIGRAFDKGHMLVLPQHLPLPIRLFVLAMQGRRS